MYKFLLIILIIIFAQLNSLAIEEVNLEKENKGLDYISDVYYGKAENQDSISPVFKLFTQKGLVFENSKINSVKATFLYGGEMSFLHSSNVSDYFKHDFSVVEPMIRVNMNENKTQAMFNINLTRNLEGYSNDFTQKIGNLYVSHNITPAQKILIGQGGRVPNTFDGSETYYNQDTVLKTQLGRTFGNTRSAGIRNIAEYKYMDYDIGVFDSTRYMKDFGHGFEFAGKILFKPFADYESEVSNFKIGASYNTGEYYGSYKQYSLFSGYDYKNFHVKTEYANADGYNGINFSQDKADGFYTTFSYDINPKISILGRYDYFTPNKNYYSSNMQEYTLGLTYKPFKNMKLMLNAVRRNYEKGSDSNMILFATKFII